MDKLRCTLFVAALLAGAPASAQVYKCVDESGKTVYLQSPCPAGQSSKVISRQAPAEAAAPAAPKPEAKGPPLTPEQAYQKRQKERAEADQKAAAESADAQRKQQACQRARESLVRFDAGGRIAAVDSKGERYFLDDSQIAQEKARAQASVNEWCK
jgi:type IV secretory pathway VirB10-like protein